MYRRNFLKTSGLLSLTPVVPSFVNTLAAHATPESEQKILVVLEMSGGNDGINTLVPYRDDEYRRRRPKLALESSSLHTITDSLGLHSSMRAGKEQFDAGELAIINGVGYPNPNRSHFESLEIWHRGLRDSKRESGAGWLGNALDSSWQDGQSKMDAYFVGRESISAALISRRAQVAALSRFSDLRLDDSIKLPNGASVTTTPQRGDIASFVTRQIADSYTTARQIESAAKSNAPIGNFPDSKLGQQLRLVSQLIKTGSAARVYYTVQGGYDTHSTQSSTHAQLLSELSRSIKAFIDDMKSSELGDRVVLLAFSEFGRRVSENDSIGTDHGTAGPVFVAGSPIRGGLIGETTNLSDLEHDDLKTQFDFRRIYSTLLDNWLGVRSTEVLGEQFEHLKFL